MLLFHKIFPFFLTFIKNHTIPQEKRTKIGQTACFMDFRTIKAYKKLLTLFEWCGLIALQVILLTMFIIN